MATLFATVVIIAVNIALRQVLTYLVDFEQLENSTATTISFALKIFVSQYINTGSATSLYRHRMTKTRFYTRVVIAFNLRLPSRIGWKKHRGPGREVFQIRSFRRKLL